VSEVLIIPPEGLAFGTGWQPIETAPMDGTEVILFYEHYLNGGFVTAGYFHVATDDYESHWYADLVNGGASPPTHWMPFPVPPGPRNDFAIASAIRSRTGETK